MKDWGRPAKVDKTLDQVSSWDYEAIVLPGRADQSRPAAGRTEAVKFIKEIFDAQKIVAAVCHAPWLLIETGIAKGRKMTSYKSIKTDVINAGAKWEESRSWSTRVWSPRATRATSKRSARRSSRRSRKAAHQAERSLATVLLAVVA